MKKNSLDVKKSLVLFGNLQVMVCAAVFAAMSIVLGKFVPLINVDVLRFSFENLPILMAGIAFGPFVGALVGGCADIIGCLLVGYTINPLVTLGAVAIGFFSGVISFYVIKDSLLPKVSLSVGAAHIIGSVLIKSIGLAAYYSYPLYQLMLIRLLNYAILAVCESTVIYLLLKNKGVNMQLNRIRRCK